MISSRRIDYCYIYSSTKSYWNKQLNMIDNLELLQMLEVIKFSFRKFVDLIKYIWASSV